MQKWISMMWNVMASTGNGYHRHSLRHTGKDEDRRNDKLCQIVGIEIVDGEAKQIIRFEAFATTGFADCLKIPF